MDIEFQNRWFISQVNTKSFSYMENDETLSIINNEWWNQELRNNEIKEGSLVYIVDLHVHMA